MCVNFCKQCGISSTKPGAGDHTHVEPTSDLCCVCQGGFDGSLMRLRKMWPCGHCIHYHCFKELKNQHKCPECTEQDVVLYDPVKAELVELIKNVEKLPKEALA